MAFMHFYAISKIIFCPVLSGKSYLTDNSISSMAHLITHEGRAINGIGVTAEDWANALQVLTMRQDLRFLTMLPCKEIINSNKLLRKTRAWCPDCYQEWHRQEKPIYDPLLWSLQAVIACPGHKRFLREKCIQCKKPHPALPRFSLPGFCPNCKSWLGDSTSNASVGDAVLTDEQLDWQRYLVNQIGDIFTVIYQGASLQRDLITNLVSTCIQRATRGDAKAFVRRFSSSGDATIRSWLYKNKRPELRRLVEIFYRTGMSMKDVLSEKLSTDVISPEVAPIRLIGSYHITADDMVRIKAALDLMLKEDPPPSQNEVSIRTGCHVATLRRRFPKLFSLIKERWSSYRADLYDKGKIKSSLIVAKEEETPRSLHSVAKMLGCSPGFLRYNFRDDCKIITKRYAESRNVFVDIDDTRAKLLALQAETPPLSIIQCAERLGCSRDNLDRYFPEIKRAIGIRYRKHCQKQVKRERERRKKIIRETVAALEAEQVNPSNYQVRKRLQDLKGLINREIDAVLLEMNVQSPISKKIK